MSHSMSRSMSSMSHPIRRAASHPTSCQAGVTTASPLPADEETPPAQADQADTSAVTRRART
jgi:hypothetical protein